MALTYREVLEARERLAEHNWRNWNGSDGVNETATKFTRYVSGINETQLDAFLEYLRYWGSTLNQTIFKLTVSGEVFSEMDGFYQDTGLAVNGHAIYQRIDGAYELRVTISDETDAYHWQLIRKSDGVILWISSSAGFKLTVPTDDLVVSDVWQATDAGVLVPKNYGDTIISLEDAVWTPNNIVHEVTDDLMVEDGWFADDEHVLEGPAGTLSIVCYVGQGMKYRSVTNPHTNNGKVRDGIWRLGDLSHLVDYDGRYGEKGMLVIMQTLELELNIVADVTEEETRWRNSRGRTHRGSNDTKVLELPYCDPSLVEELVKQNTESTYTNSIYTVDDGLLAGTWHNIHTDYEIDPRNGYATLLWTVSKQANDDVHFANQKNDGTFAVDFYKFDAADTGLASFETDYYFDALGDWYVSTDGVNYTSKNGTAAEGALPVGNGIGNMRTPIEGRTTSVQISRSETTRFYQLHAHIEFADSKDFSVSVYSDEITLQSRVSRWMDAADVDSFPATCWVSSTTGAVTVGADPGDGSVALNTAVAGRVVEINPVYDGEQDRYRVDAVIRFSGEVEAIATYYKKVNTQAVEFELVGVSASVLQAKLSTTTFNGSTLEAAVAGREAAVNLSFDEGTKLYRLTAKVEFVGSLDFSLVFYKDPYTIVSNIVSWMDAADVDGFPAKCWVSPAGAVEISDTVVSGSVALSTTTENRTVEIQPSYDPAQGRYRVEAKVTQFQQLEIVVSYAKSKSSRAIDFRLFGASKTALIAALENYYFAADGDWFYSEDSETAYLTRAYSKKNGESATGLLSSENAFNIQTPDTAADSRRVSPPRIERNPIADVYQLQLQIEYASAVTTGNTAAYGTPLVKVTDILVVGEATLPDVSGSAGYNDEGTKETETRILDPRYDVESETYSYIERTIEKWAPHADQNPLLSDDVTTNPDYALPGYVEGTSEIRNVVESLPLARGVSSGFFSAGAWSGGGKGRIQHVTGADGIGDGYSTSFQNVTAQVTKKFRPFNITLARSCVERVSSRLYYYVKEPTEDQYPSVDAVTIKPIEELESSALGSSTHPTIIKTEVTDDTALTFGQSLIDYQYNDYYGKLVKFTYSDGTFTLVYYGAEYEYPSGSSYPGAGHTAADFYDIVTWREIKFIRTYPAEGDGTATGYGDGTVRVDEAGLKADPAGTLTDDDGLYMGHYIIEDLTDDAEPVQKFRTELLRHQIIPLADSIYALLVETTERTAWKMDPINKWILNAEGLDMQYGVPPSTPSLADGDNGSNIPYQL